MATALPQTSSQLNRVLDAYGLSRSFTDYRRRAIIYALIGIVLDGDMIMVPVGSKRDALCSSMDTESDIDFLYILPAAVFNEKNQDEMKRYVSTQIKKDFPVFILENGPSPGYKYLKCLVKGYTDRPSTYTHFRGFTYLLNTREYDIPCSDNHFDPFQLEVNGPALSMSGVDGEGEEEIAFKCDAVMAFCCPFLPTDFDEWCNRKRHHRWPPKWIIETTKKYGCLVVGVGHQTSETQAIEWRLSLTKTELLLTKSFNHIQMKCYAMLKLVLKWIIQPQMKESLSSYHVKTVMFWMSEEREKRFWIPENLFECFISSMMKLKTYVENKYCRKLFPD
ncbi:uncharacterized protein LOC110442670 [Mizuhopecten yessoensis]|uniref:uncharacterized protein LOC110442670 n=1 Tax=Mizuhopecten yessoensis TaxID=6573 RepID=UPI000B4585A8|nr:uncharacterized protein LOC110442670 [Mizuhopecten yessoensis]XP_021342059.1 uncharacterized protein LOC110442670 [Mizuhopecten yessoensis]